MTEPAVDKVAFVHTANGKVLLAINQGSDKWYLPGGHREEGETDHQVLIREVEEELAVELIPDTIAYFNTFEAQADGHPPGAVARIICYTASFNGEVTASSEIAAIGFFSNDDKPTVSEPARLALDFLKGQGLIE